MSKSKVKVIFKESVHSFKKGTKVKLRNSDNIMTVKGTISDNITRKTFIICTWKYGKELKEGQFEMFDLENVS